MIKLMDILKEISGNPGSYLADEGDNETMFLDDGQIRVLNKTKPEPWFKKGGYLQIWFPEADDVYGDLIKDKDSKVKKIVAVNKISNISDDYFEELLASWDKYGSEDYSLEYETEE